MLNKEQLISVSSVVYVLLNSIKDWIKKCDRAGIFLLQYLFDMAEVENTFKISQILCKERFGKKP